MGEPIEDAIQTISRIFRIREATLANGKLVIIDDARQDGTRSMTFESVETSLVIRAERGQADLRVSVGHAGDKGRSAISLAGTISTAQRQTLAIDDSSGSQVTLQFDGTLEAANLNLREAAEFLGPAQFRSSCRGSSMCTVTFGPCLALRAMMSCCPIYPPTSNN